MAQYFKGLKFGSITGFADCYDNPLYDSMFDQGVKGYSLHLGTQFPLSKRTSLYTGACFAKAKVDATSAGPVQDRDVQKQEIMQAYFGMTHKF